MLLHGRVGAVDERPVEKRKKSQLGNWKAICHGVRMYTPCGSACLRSLAEQEAELLQALGEDVLARHCGWDGQANAKIMDMDVLKEPREDGRGGSGIELDSRCSALFTMAVIRCAEPESR